MIISRPKGKNRYTELAGLPTTRANVLKACTDQATYKTVKEIHRWRDTYISYYPCSIERVRGGLIHFHEDHVDAMMLRKDP